MTVNKDLSSRIPGFYALSREKRVSLSKAFAGLNFEEQQNLASLGNLPESLLEGFIENSVGCFALPLGVATNFLIDGNEILVPMAVEETSVIAAASHGAKLARSGGGFHTKVDPPIMIGQIQLFTSSVEKTSKLIAENEDSLIRYANQGHERLCSRGGGLKSIITRAIDELGLLVVHLHIHTGDAMGANIVNTYCEKLAMVLRDLCDAKIGLKILSNLSDQRMAKSYCEIPAQAFDTKHMTGKEVISRIEQAYLFAKYDIYRAATHNKGVMNGIDPVLIATGNDWRAIEAGAHAYCARGEGYQPMTKWWVEEDNMLCGEIEIPMAVGTVGGVTKLHPTAKVALKLMNSPNASGLAGIIVSVGLAQNLSALRALATEGIQFGHMRLHQHNLDMLRSYDKKSTAAK